MCHRAAAARHVAVASRADVSDVSDVCRIIRANADKSPMSSDLRNTAEKAHNRPVRTIYFPYLRLGSQIISVQPAEGVNMQPRDFR